MYRCVYTHVSKDVHRAYKRMSGPLELKLQALMSCLTCVLGVKLWPYARIEQIGDH